MRLIYGCFLVLGSLVILATASANPTTQQPKPPGKLVDIGGYRLYLNCTGKGSPTVILDYGGGGVSTVWALVQPEIARFTHVCSYDHAYDGFSDPGPIPTTFHQQAFELRLLLQTEHISPPYVLVGHSQGGLLDQVYKSVYSNEVAGMVLVDSTDVDSIVVAGGKPLRSNATGKPIPPPHTTAGTELPAYTPEEQQAIDKRAEQLAKAAENPVQPPFENIPKNIQPIWRLEYSLNKPPPGAGGSPWFAWFAEEADQLYRERQGTDHIYGDMPLVVLAAATTSYPDRLQIVYNQAKMSTNSLLIIDPQSKHYMQLYVPGLVIRSVREVVESVQQNKRVTAIP